jgi:hypothetical protein
MSMRSHVTHAPIGAQRKLHCTSNCPCFAAVRFSSENTDFFFFAVGGSSCQQRDEEAKKLVAGEAAPMR